MRFTTGMPFPLVKADPSPFVEGEAAQGKEMLKSLMDATAHYEEKKRELAAILRRIERSGIDVGPLKQSIWNYAEAFAGWEAVKRLNKEEKDTLERYKIPDK